MSFNDMFRLSCHAVILNNDGYVLQLKHTYNSNIWGIPGRAVLGRGAMYEKVSEKAQNRDNPVLYFNYCEHRKTSVFRCFPFLILDEVSSALDENTALEIENRLLELDIGFIYITHKYSKHFEQKVDAIVKL